MIDFYNFSSVRKGPPHEIRLFLTNLIFFRQNEIILRGKKNTSLFQTYDWEKSSFFNALVRCLDVRAGGGRHKCPNPLANRVKVHIALAFRKFSMTKKRTILRFK